MIDLAVSACFQIHPADNVATMLEDGTGDARVLGAATADTVTLPATVAAGHKVALTDLAPGAAVIKYGVRIGHATKAIPRGAWVHLHNLASDLDQRSASLDPHSGEPTDTSSAYV